ncbi:UNVERIFIED_CONTAM: hypothetical protein FKN15_006476 [Acipenser sinensis]
MPCSTCQSRLPGQTRPLGAPRRREGGRAAFTAGERKGSRSERPGSAGAATCLCVPLWIETASRNGTEGFCPHIRVCNSLFCCLRSEKDCFW